MVAPVKNTFSCLSALFVIAITVMLSACGGGGSSPKLSTQVVSGVASVGAGLAGQVQLKDAGGASKTTVIGADGSYAIDVTGMKGPFLLQASGTANGTSYKLNSYAASSGTANANPLSHIAVASAAGMDDPYASADSRTMSTIGDNLPATMQTLLAKLKPLLMAYNAQNADPITGHYSADHTGLDGMFDNIKVSLVSGTITITNAATGAVIFSGSITDLQNGQFNSGGVPSTPTLPAAPMGVMATGGAGQVSLSWGAVSNATGYNIYWSTTAGVTTGNGTKIAATGNSFVQTGLQAGTTYYYVITAVNAAGESAASAQASASTNAAPPVVTVPAAPMGVMAAGGTKQTTVSWPAVTGATSYNVYYSTSSGVTTTSGTKLSGATSPSVVTNLADSTTYYFIVTAVNSAGESAASVQVAATTLTPAPAPTAPAAPTGVTATGGANQATISWQAVSGATSYNVYYSTTSGVTTTSGTRKAGVSSPYVLTGLSAGTTYYVVVTAANAVGESAASAQASATTNAPPPAIPAAPTGVTATGGTNQVTVSWPAVSGATSYNLYWSTKTGVTTTSGTKISGATSPYLQTGLAAGTSYYYVVTAVNSSGESAASAQVSAATAAPAPVLPTAPTGVAGTGGTKQVTVSWSAVSGATSYNLYYSTVSGVTTATGNKVVNVSSPYVLTGLLDGTAYYFVVTAVNAAGEGPASAQASAGTAAAAFDGAAFYTANCAGCHGPLATSRYKGATPAMITAGIQNVGAMKQFSYLTAAQINAISVALQ
ncbi:fibronectin type III domain-containing protein [Geomonas sp.]|uniref:fibronectin type III domain-containing protein n=1 Tax=Geomonas sp. TaxID=2651584 RepID=UPI002B49A2AA|nr:fibronectin type III domain-containing protein [Geomonas sp.]HJV34105.1 fibronectin type III domain-containing protein [Geomonas sp.]